MVVPSSCQWCVCVLETSPFFIFPAGLDFANCGSTGPSRLLFARPLPAPTLFIGSWNLLCKCSALKWKLLLTLADLVPFLFCFMSMSYSQTLRSCQRLLVLYTCALPSCWLTLSPDTSFMNLLGLLILIQLLCCLHVGRVLLHLLYSACVFVCAIVWTFC